MGGLGESTSTLVGNDDTGRYVIRDVDDDILHDDIDSGGINFPRVHLIRKTKRVIIWSMLGQGLWEHF